MQVHANSKEPQKALNVRNYHYKLEILFIAI
jgi:hypothetical protein